ncbi:MAG: hypothetical protein JNM68_01625, partial [Dinghuibacter sp.]|nr:hypothetical protein [Dinghuibacter sp.]
MSKRFTVCSRVFIVLLLITSGTLLSSFNSQEHKIIGDMAISRVRFPGSIIFPSGVGFLNHYQSQYLAGWQQAKILAVGFGTNNQNDYDQNKKGVQDNCYWTGFGQLDYNKNNFIEPLAQMPNGPILYVSNIVGNQSQPYTFGDLVALYGDYRR